MQTNNLPETYLRERQASAVNIAKDIKPHTSLSDLRPFCDRMTSDDINTTTNTSITLLASDSTTAPLNTSSSAITSAKILQVQTIANTTAAAAVARYPVSSNISSSPADTMPSIPSQIVTQSSIDVSGGASILQDLSLQQHMLQVKQHQLLQQQLLEEQFYRSKEKLHEEHERQLTVFLQQAEAQRTAKENIEHQERCEKVRLEELKQKSCQQQSAVASPEVKRHLQEFVLQKKRKEAAAASSMGCLKIARNPIIQRTNSSGASGSCGPNNMSPISSAVLHGSILRKTASESNLLKMKTGKRNWIGAEGSNSSASGCRVGPYQRLNNIGGTGSFPSAIPEASAMSIVNTNKPPGGDSQQGSPGSSNHSLSSFDPVSSSHCSSTMPNVFTSAIQFVPISKDLSQTVTTSVATTSCTRSSAPTSPKLYEPDIPQPVATVMSHKLNLKQFSIEDTSSNINSRSLPNIPTAIGRLACKEKFIGRRSPPSHTGSMNNNTNIRQAPSHHSAFLVRRSKSSAILPLRKHLIEKTLMEQKSKDEEQIYMHQKQQISNDRLSMIRPIREVLEEPSTNQPYLKRKPFDRQEDYAMETDDDSSHGHQQHQQSLPWSFAARLGHAGLSPLVLGDVGANLMQDCTSQNVSLMLNKSQTISFPNAATTGETFMLPYQLRSGLGFNSIMKKHECECKDIQLHPENPTRLESIWEHLVDMGLADQCVTVSKIATEKELLAIHSRVHVEIYGFNSGSSKNQQCIEEENERNDSENDDTNTAATTTTKAPMKGGSKFSRLKCGGLGVDADTFWNEKHTALAAKTAAGTVIDLSIKVARGELKNGFAIVRPPGHHAEYDESMGFCYFNSVAIAAKQLLERQLAKRILIIDWAIHHGNGTQQAFYDSYNVLYISLHRYDNGNFYPGTGGPTECGTGLGVGFNVNIAWTGGLEPPMGDAEYLAAFRSVIMPIARAFNPDMVLVSAGFDAAVGHFHPIGGYLVSPECFAFLTLQLKQLAEGKIVLALEGGYNLKVLKITSEQCLKALMDLPLEKISEAELTRRPCQPAVETLQKTMAIHLPYWEALRHRPQESYLLSHLEAWEQEKNNCSEGNLTISSFNIISGGQSDELSGMAKLSMKHKYHSQHHLESWTCLSRTGSEEYAAPDTIID